MGIFSALSKKIEERQEGIKPSDLLELPKSLRTLMLTINRMKTLDAETAATQVGQSIEETQHDLDLLVEKGYLQYDPMTREYRVRYGRLAPQAVPGSLWAALDDKTKGAQEQEPEKE
ncbi:MAG TPA: hypothetical protein PLJ78_02490 [Anaerolineae bacterium]|nr:hypothetical protein [Anaerolineae bacterium]HQK12793.1 hypothetical protein [Anaerolineae bacterium]